MNHSTREPQSPVSGRGVTASLGASVLFGAIFTLPPLLRPLDPQQILAYRIVAMVVLLAAVFCVIGGWSEVALVLRRCRRRPVVGLVLTVDGALLGAQLWVFGWAPQTGHGLDVSLGYLILPLVMVVVGVVVFGDRLSRLRAAAVCAAAIGVAAAVVLTGGVGWPTVLVACGFPAYFVIRRVSALDSNGAQLLEMVAMLPFAVVVLVVRPSLDILTSSPGLAVPLVLLGVLSAAGFTFYLTASRALPFALFGVLGYVEPLLLVVVSLTLLGEPWTAADVVVYGPIGVGLALLAVGTRRLEDHQPDRLGGMPASTAVPGGPANC